MANKKHHRPKPATSSSITTNPPRQSTVDPASGINGTSSTQTGITAARATRVAGTAVTSKTKDAGETRKLAASIGRRIMRILGSLQLAVILLSTFVVVMIIGWFTESGYQTPAAQALVYRAWWFNFLLFMLAVNIFFAAAKKWPFKKHQTGFVVTHIGLILMLVGGLVNYFGGVDAQMALLDTADPEVQKLMASQEGTIPNSSDKAYYADISEIRVQELGSQFKNGTHQWKADFRGGVLPWRPVAGAENVNYPLGIRLLGWLGHPFGQRWSMGLDGGAQLEIINYLPMSVRADYTPVDSKQREASPAFKLVLASEKFAEPLDAWIGLVGKRQFGLGNLINVEIIGRVHPVMLSEFLNPPAPEDLGRSGVLAVAVNGKIHRLPVDSSLNRWVPVGDDGLQIRIMDVIDSTDGHLAEVAPGLSFQMKGLPNSDPQITYDIYARASGIVLERKPNAPVQPFAEGVGGKPSFFYHPSTLISQSNPGVNGAMQFIFPANSNEEMYYRSYRMVGDHMALERSGPVDLTGKAHRIWDKMAWSFRIGEFLPAAVHEPRYLPVSLLPGQEKDLPPRERQKYVSALRCRLSAPNAQPVEFWLQKHSSRQVTLGDRQFRIGFHYKEHELGFEIKLERAEQTVDPGTGRPASYTSYVQLYDEKLGIFGEHREITMNQPLEHRGYMFYQSEMSPINDNRTMTQVHDHRNRPVNYSGFTVGSDPGLRIKYLGSLCLGLGIAIMFYMRAYFFAPRKRKPAPTEASS